MFQDEKHGLRILFFVERNLHLPFLEPIHDYFQEYFPHIAVAFASPPYSEPRDGEVGRGLEPATLRRLASKSAIVSHIPAFAPDITVVADIGAAYILRDCGRIVNVGHGMISKGCFYTRRPLVRRENMADLICVPGPWHRDILAESVSSAIEVTGFIKADGLFGPKAFSRERFCSEHGIPPDEKIILFAPTYNEELSAIPCVKTRVGELASPGVHLVIKLHGMTDQRWVRIYRDLAASRPNIHFLPVSHDLTRAMAAADIMISDVSSAFVEFMLLDRPIVLFENPRFREFVHYDPEDIEYQVRDACALTRSWDELRAEVRHALAHPEALSAVRTAYAHKLCSGRDGRSVERAAQAIAGLPARRHPVAFSVVVPWKRMATTAQAAEAEQRIRASVPGVDMEVLFLGPRADDVQSGTDSPWIKCAGISGTALDDALRAASHEYVAVVDPDLVLPAGWIRQLYNYFLWEENTGIAQALGPGHESRTILGKLMPGAASVEYPDAAFLLHRYLQGAGMPVASLDGLCFLLCKSRYVLAGVSLSGAGWEKALEVLAAAMRRNGLRIRRAVETFVYPQPNAPARSSRTVRVPADAPVRDAKGGAVRNPDVPEVSIVIPVRNNKQLTVDCLAAVHQNTTSVAYEVVAVDNASEDGVREMLLDLHREGALRCIANPVNMGFAAACNQGAALARGKYVVFLNNDTRVMPGWLHALVSCAAGDETIAAVGSKLVFEDGLVQHAGVVFDHHAKPVHIYKFFHPQHPAVRKTRDFQAVSAACMLVKKAVFHEMGGFDEQFVNGYEDVDFCLRLRADGHRVVYCPKSVVTHLESRTAGRFDAMEANRRLLMQRWGDVIRRDERDYYRQDGIDYELVEEHERGHVCVMHDSSPNTYWQRAKRLAEQGAVDKAVGMYHEAFRFFAFDPRKFSVLAELADLCERHGLLSDAEYYSRGLVETAPRPEHYLRLARILEKQGKVDEAAEIMAQGELRKATA